MSPSQERTLGGLIATLEAASEQMGNKIAIEGWAAEAQSPQHWTVAYTYLENKTDKTYRFAVDLGARDVQGENPEGITLLSFFRQQAQAGILEPTPTTVAIRHRLGHARLFHQLGVLRTRGAPPAQDRERFRQAAGRAKAAFSPYPCG